MFSKDWDKFLLRLRRHLFFVVYNKIDQFLTWLATKIKMLNDNLWLEK